MHRQIQPEAIPGDDPRAAPWLRTVFFLIGAITLIQQTLLLREFFVIAQGNELSFGICLGNWLLGVFFGSLAGGRIADRSRRLPCAFICSLGLLSTLAPLLLLLVRLIHWLNETPFGTVIPLEGVFFYSALVTLPFSFVVGLLFPLAARLYSLGSGRAARAVTGFYALEAAGSLAGGLVYTFLLAGRVRTLAVSAGSVIVLATFLTLLCRQWRLRRAALFNAAIATVLLVALASGAIWRCDRHFARLRWQSMGSGELVEALDSRYQNLQLGKQSGQFSLYSNGQLATAFPEPESNRLLAVHLLCQHPRPRKMLVLGEAASGLAMQLLESPLEEIVAVELDMAIVELIRRHLPDDERRFLGGPRCRFLGADGRLFLKALARVGRPSDEKFDILFIHVGEPSTALANRFFTRDFFQDAVRALSPEGIIALPLLPAEDYARGDTGRFNASIWRTLQEVFPHTALMLGPQPLLFASRHPGVVSESAALLRERYREMGLLPRSWSRIFDTLYPQEKIASQLAALAEQKTRVNRDAWPVSYYLYTKIVGWYSGSRLSTLMVRMERLHPSWLLPLPLLPLLWRVARTIALRRRGRRPMPPLLFIMAAAGFSGLALEMLLIYWLQVRFGHAYGSVGLIVALFMAGSALGAIACRRMLLHGSEANSFRLLMAGNFFMAAIAGLLVWCAGLQATPAMLIFCLTAAVGATMGAIFSGALHLKMQTEGKTGRQSAAVNAADHLGAAAGALLTSAFLLPLLGLSVTALLIAGLAVTSGFMLAMEKCR